MKYRNACTFSALCLICAIFYALPVIHTILCLPVIPFSAIALAVTYAIPALVISLHNRICNVPPVYRICSACFSWTFCIISIIYAECPAEAGTADAGHSALFPLFMHCVLRYLPHLSYRFFLLRYLYISFVQPLICSLQPLPVCVIRTHRFFRSFFLLSYIRQALYGIWFFPIMSQSTQTGSWGGAACSMS